MKELNEHTVTEILSKLSYKDLLTLQTVSKEMRLTIQNLNTFKKVQGHLESFNSFIQKLALPHALLNLKRSLIGNTIPNSGLSKHSIDDDTKQLFSSYIDTKDPPIKYTKFIKHTLSNTKLDAEFLYKLWIDLMIPYIDHFYDIYGDIKDEYTAANGGLDTYFMFMHLSFENNGLVFTDDILKYVGSKGIKYYRVILRYCVHRTENQKRCKHYTVLTGGLSPRLAKTNKHASVGNKTRVVYMGPRGGEYIKINNKWVSLKQSTIITQVSW